MSIIQAFAGALSGTFADQWKEIVVPGHFDEYSAVVPGCVRRSNNDRGVNYSSSGGVISNGSKIFVPEGTAAFIFSQGKIESIITEPGGYEYQSGQASIFNGDGIKESFLDQVFSRIGYGGQPSVETQVAFINLREIRGLKFGTRGPLMYNDLFYGADLEITAFGTFSLRITDVETFIRNFVPPNTNFYNFQDPEARQQLMAEFIQAFTVTLNSLSTAYRISQLPSHANVIATKISAAGEGSLNWAQRFGVEVVSIGIEAIEFTPASKALVNQYSENRMNLKAYENINQQSSNMAAQQKIAEGVQAHGLGDGGGMLFGMNMAQSMNPQTGAQETQAIPTSTPSTSNLTYLVLSIDEQVEAIKKMKELLDAGILTEEEFEAKKAHIMGV